MVGPVDHATLVIPFIPARESDFIALTQGVYSWRKINIVSDQYCMAGLKTQNKPLVPGTFVVIGKDLCHDTRFRYRKITGAIPIGIFNSTRGLDEVGLSGCRNGWRFKCARRLRQAGSRGCWGGGNRCGLVLLRQEGNNQQEKEEGCCPHQHLPGQPVVHRLPSIFHTQQETLPFSIWQAYLPDALYSLYILLRFMAHPERYAAINVFFWRGEIRFRN